MANKEKEEGKEELYKYIYMIKIKIRTSKRNIRLYKKSLSKHEQVFRINPLMASRT